MHETKRLIVDHAASAVKGVVVKKMLMVGDTSSGKRDLMRKYTTDDGSISTIGIDFKTRVVTTEGGTKVKLHIWDTAGQERFKVMDRD